MSNFKIGSQKAALVKELLDGKEISVMTAFKTLLLTNCAREVGRSIVNPETGFGAKVTKTRIDFTSTYGKKGFYFTYKLERSEANKTAIEKMKLYLSQSDLKPVEKEDKRPSNSYSGQRDLFGGFI